jgi:hypothetical protein
MRGANSRSAQLVSMTCRITICRPRDRALNSRLDPKPAGLASTGVGESRPGDSRRDGRGTHALKGVKWHCGARIGYAQVAIVIVLGSAGAQP